MTCVGYHKEIEITTGNCVGRNSFKVCKDKNQLIDQVFCAAMNMSQGSSGSYNRQLDPQKKKCRFVLDSAYQGTYLSAIKYKREKIFLTLIGGGVFGNPHSQIFGAIVEAHKKWANNLHSNIKEVTVVLYSYYDYYGAFPNLLEDENIPYKIIQIKNGQKTVEKSFLI